MATVMPIWQHAISMVGFGKIKVNDLVLDGNIAPNQTEIRIEEGNPWIGQTYWIFKESWGFWGQNQTEFYYVIASPSRFNTCYSLISPVTSMNYDDSDIKCLDSDGDGYYNWGISTTKPNTCPTCSDSCDCDDSKSYLGPFDENYNCKLLCNNFTLDHDTLFVSSDDTWYGKRYINKIIFIENQTKLTIKGDVGFCEGSTIIVDRGAELIIDGGIIHGTCSNMWQGIEVWGATTTSQSTSGAQGKITIVDGGTIKDAVLAVVLARTDGTRYAAGYEGGIIQTNDAHFFNNRTGVRFLPYRNMVSGVEMNNLSYFQNTEFLTDAELADESIPENFLYLDGVRGINIQGCTFTNSRPEEASMSHRGIGIYCYDANFNVSWYYGEESISSKFTNLNYGIHALDATTTKTFQVNHSDFNNNLTGIYCNNVHYSTIIFNDFELYNVSLFHGPNDIFGGIYYDHCTGFTVEENNFFR